MSTKKLRRLIAGVGAVAALSNTFVNAKNADQAPLTESSNPYVCEHPPYKVHLVSHSPLVIYLENFVTPKERAHLLKISENTFTPSGITSNTSIPIRTSHSTSLPPTDPIVHCISQRALSFQGFDTPLSHLEPLQLVRYLPSQYYHHHTDWFTSPVHSSTQLGGNRLTSFFIYIKVLDGTIGGGTNFPRLEPLIDEKWCEKGWVDCDEEWERGVTFRAMEGNGVFWVNLVDGGDGRRYGDERVLHAGVPVVRGEKVGMNIWTREGPVDEAIRGVA